MIWFFRISVILDENLFDDINKQIEQIIKQSNPISQNNFNENLNKESTNILIDFNRKSLVKLELINSNINAIKELLLELMEQKRT